MKQKIYYITFSLLGALVGFFLHGVIEIFVIKMLLKDFQKYGLGLSWTAWENIHNVGVIVLILGLGLLGFKSGKKWWRILYVEKKYSKKWGIKLKENF